MSKSIITTETIERILTYTFPKLQRNLVTEHIQSMVDDQINEYNLHKCFSMLQSITVASLGNELYVLDGQHRIKAFAMLRELGYPVNNISLPVVIYYVDTKDELISYYKRINKNMPIHPFETDKTWEIVGKYLCDMMQKHFHHYIKHVKETSLKTCRCPHISMNELKSHIQARNIQHKLEEYRSSIEDLWNVILSINSYIDKEVKSHIQLCAQSMRRIQECESKSRKHKCNVCFLGIWRRFEWLDIALYILSKGHKTIDKVQLNLSDFASETRTRIPYYVREHVWKKIHMNTCDDGICYCCESSLKFVNMECGHIIAHSLGGKSCVDNFMPICKTCNRDMGIMNLYDYKMMLKSMMNN